MLQPFKKYTRKTIKSLKSRFFFFFFWVNDVKRILILHVHVPLADLILVETDHEIVFTAIPYPVQLIQEVAGESMHRNSVSRLTDRLDMS